MPYRNIAKVQTILAEATGLGISCIEDDLVLAEDNDFLLRFDHFDENSFHCYFHENCTFSTEKHILDNLELVCEDYGCTLIPEGNFTLSANGPKLEVYIL